MARKKVDFRRTGIWPLAYMGVEPVSAPLMVTNNRAPTTGDYQNYNIGSLWINRATAPDEETWILVNKDNGSARWIKFLTSVAGLQTLTGDIGGAVGPDGAFNINIIGSGPYLFTGNPGTHTLQMSDDGTIATTYIADVNLAVPVGGILNVLGGTRCQTTGDLSNTLTIDFDATGLSSSFITDAGTAIPNAAGELNVLGGLNIETAGAGNTVTVATVTLASGIIHVDGSGAFTSIGNGTDGQVIIGATGGAPAWNNITSSGGTIAITNGPNTINLEAIAGGAGSFTTDSGVANAVAGNINILGGDNINTAGAADNVYVHLDEVIRWPATNPTGTTGVIYLGGASGAGGYRYVHNYGSQTGQSTNTFYGAESGNFTLTTTSAIRNTGVGSISLQSLTTGASNTGVGAGTLWQLTTGSNNTAVGDVVLGSLLTGSNNTAIGYTAGQNYTGAESNNICIQNVGTTGESNVTRIGTSQTKCFIAGIRGITTGVADAINVLIDSSGQLGTVSSSIRYKQNVKDIGDESKALKDLRPVTFEYKSHPGMKQYGLIAEEVEKIFPRLVVYDKEGLPETVKYMDLIPLLLNEVQRLSKRVSQLKKEL